MTRPAPPFDPALPQLGRLLDEAAMAPVLRRSLGRDASVEAVRIARVVYKPGDRIAVHYEAAVEGRSEDAVAQMVAGRDMAAKVIKPRYLELARRIDGRAPAASPVTYVRELDALVSWLPFDLALPALAEPTQALARRLRAVGVDVAESAGEPVRLPKSYKPGARITLRLGGHLLKAYGKERQYRTALAGLRAAASTRLRVPRFEAALPELRLTAQSFVEGATPAAPEAAEKAGWILRRLHDSAAAPARITAPAALLDTAVEKSALLRRLVPELERRLGALERRLTASMPVDDRLVPAHGDFHADQLLEVDGALVVIDFDDLRLAPPTLDLATYLGDLVQGADGDVASVEPVAGPLLEGYGERPPALEWHLAIAILTRAPRPFRRLAPAWPERVERLVAAAEAVLS